MENVDNIFMQYALKEAEKAFFRGEVPIGALIVFEGRIISKAHNQVELLKDATAHAEMLAITSACGYFGDWRLAGTTIYTTVEPCVMCAGAIISSRIERVVWGARDVRVGANGSFVEVFKKHPIHKVEISGGVLEERSSYLLKKFFEKRRGEKKLGSF